MDILEQAVCKRFDTFFNSKSHLNLMLKPIRLWRNQQTSYVLLNVQGYFLHLSDDFIGNPNNHDHTLKQLKNLAPSVGLSLQMVLPLNQNNQIDYHEHEDVHDFLTNRVFFIPNRTILYLQQFHKKSHSFHSPKLSADNLKNLMHRLSDWFAQELNNGVDKEILMQTALILVGKDFIDGFQRVVRLLPRAGDIPSFLDTGIKNDPSFDAYIRMFEAYLNKV